MSAKDGHFWIMGGRRAFLFCSNDGCTVRKRTDGTGRWQQKARGPWHDPRFPLYRALPPCRGRKAPTPG